MELATAVQDLVTQAQVAASYAFSIGLLGGLAYILLPAIRLTTLGTKQQRRYDNMDQAIARRIFRY